MRMLLALAVLLIVAVTVLKLMKSQLAHVAVTAAPAAGASQPSATLGAPPIAEQIQRGLEAGAAARASEPTP